MARPTGTRPHLRWSNEKDAWVATGKGGSPIFELPYRFTPTCETTLGDPGRQMYLQRTHRGTITAGKSLTGLMVSQTFNGNGDSGNIDGSEFKARGNTDGTYDLDGMRAVVANCDPKKTDVSGIARCIEAVFENSNGSTVTEARAISAKIQASGVVTTGYVLYAEGHSAVYADYGLYIRYCTNGILIENAAVSATGKNGIKVANTFTLATTGVHKGIQSDITYSGGYATPIGVAGKVTLTGNFTGGTGYMWGVQGNLDLGTSGVIQP